jgi:hypothetical protein
MTTWTRSGFEVPPSSSTADSVALYAQGAAYGWVTLLVNALGCTVGLTAGSC